MQQFYQDAVEKKTQTWKIMENLRSERILNGIENLENLNATLSQSLWSVHSYNNQGRLGSIGSSNESLISKRASTSSLGEHPSLTHTTSADRVVGSSNRLQKLRSNFKSMGSVDFTYVCPPSLNGLRLERTLSEDKLNERPRSLCDMGSESGIPGSNGQGALTHLSLSEETELSNANSKSGRLSPVSRKIHPPELASLRRSPYLSDDSGTEGSDTNADDSQPPLSRRRLSDKGRETLAMFTKKFSDPGGSMSRGSNDDSLKYNPSLSFPETSYPLISISSRSPSPRFDEKLNEGSDVAKKDPAPTANGMVMEVPKMDTLKVMDALKVMDTLQVQMASKITKRHSVGSLGDPQLQSLFPRSFNTLPSPRRMSQLVNSQNSSSLTTSNLHTRSRSESCLLSASHGSHFDVVYVDPTYRKPKVSTVEEEEEAQTNCEQFKLSDESTTDESLVRESVLRLSSDEAPTPPKSATKSKVMFSELTEVHSFVEESGGESEMDSKPNSPSKRQFRQAWRQVTSTEQLSESPTESFQMDTSLPGEPKAFDATLDDKEMAEERRRSADIDVQLVKINLAKPPERLKSNSLLSEVIDAYSQSLFGSELPATEPPAFEPAGSKPACFEPDSELPADSKQPSSDSAQPSPNSKQSNSILTGSAPKDTSAAPETPNSKLAVPHCESSDSKPLNSDSKSMPSKPSDSKSSGSKPSTSKPPPAVAATDQGSPKVNHAPTRTLGPLTTLPPVRRATRFTQQRTKKESKPKQQSPGKSVWELSRMFEAPAKSPGAVVPSQSQSPIAAARHTVLTSGSKIGNGKSAAAKPSSGAQVHNTTTKTESSISKDQPDLAGKRVSASHKRKEAVTTSKIPTPSSSPLILERRKPRTSTSNTNGMAMEGNKPKSLSRSTPSPAPDTNAKRSLFSAPETNGIKSAVNEDGRSPKTQRSKRGGVASPSTKPKPVRGDLSMRTRLRATKQTGGTSGKDSKMVSSGVPKGNSNCSNNMGFSGAEYTSSSAADVATPTPPISDICDDDAHCESPQPSQPSVPESRTIFRPRRHFSDSDNQFEEGSILRKKLMKQQYSASDIDRVLKSSHPTTPARESTHRYSAISRSQTFKSTHEWMNFGGSLPLKEKSKTIDKKHLLRDRRIT